VYQHGVQALKKSRGNVWRFAEKGVILWHENTEAHIAELVVAPGEFPMARFLCVPLITQRQVDPS
ncbi:MAG: hypothetical protein K2G81_02070, partial [Muribaculaceae bacterium]|nr:hypothetical protein [Muribaculaceae bacterium]